MANPAAPLVRTSAAEAVTAVRQSGGVRRVAAPMTFIPNRHMMSRFAFGPTQDRTGTPDTWFDAQIALAASRPGYRGVPALATLYPYLALSVPQTRATLRNNGNEYGWDSMEQLERATLALQCWSPAQLFETAVDFFSNKLNVANYSDGVWVSRLSFDRDVIRANALGKYRTMLLAAMKHPAMLTYLNNDVSTWEAPNENLGRELLELHTVGIETGYTQTDVVNSARILTGRGVDWRYGDYMWSQGAHWIGKVQVLGFKHANNSPAKGESVGDQYLTYLANHPNTAAKLARQLCVRYVSDTPSDTLVGAVAAAYLANDTAIVPMLRTIFTSTEFWDSVGAKVRRPLENLIATIRILGKQAKDQSAAMDNMLGTMGWLTQSTGQKPLCWSPPNGYPDVAAAWRSSGNLLTMWDHQMGMAQNWWDDQFTSVPTAFWYGGTSPATVGAALDAISNTLFSAPLAAADKTTLLTYLGESATLAIGRSKLQWELPNVATILLHSAAHAYR